MFSVFSILVAIALLLAIVAMIFPQYPLLGVAMILVCVALLASPQMKIALLFSISALTGCYPFYEADATNWTVGVRGTHQEVADFVTNIVDPDAKSLAK